MQAGIDLGGDSETEIVGVRHTGPARRDGALGGTRDKKRHASFLWWESYPTTRSENKPPNIDQTSDITDTRQAAGWACVFVCLYVVC